MESEVSTAQPPEREGSPGPSDADCQAEETDVLLISEQHNWSENSAWYQQDASRRAGILVCSLVLSIGDFLKTDRGFVWVEVAGVRVYSCYFSSNDPFEIFETQILLLEESLREASGRSLIMGDFNSKSPEWGEAHLDRRGILVVEMVARNDLIVLNRSKDFTFRRGAAGSIIDTARRFSNDKLRKHLEENRLIDELGWAKSTGSLEDTVRAARGKVVGACAQHGHGRTGDSMYWWNEQLSVLRREFLTAQRKFTRSKGDFPLHEARKIAKSALRQGVMKSKL